MKYELMKYELTDDSLLNQTIHIIYWSRSSDPDGAPCAEAFLSQGTLRFYPLDPAGTLESKFEPMEVWATHLAPQFLDGFTPAQPWSYLKILLRRFSGSYFWIEARLILPLAQEVTDA